MTWLDRPLPPPDCPGPGWRPGPGTPDTDAGTVLRWWDGIAWTHQFAFLGSAPDAPTAPIRIPPTKGS